MFLTLLDPAISLGNTSGSRKLVQLTANLRLTSPGELSVAGIGGASGVDTTIFAPADVENITNFRFTSGIFDASNGLQGLPLTLAGGGLTIRNGTTSLTNTVTVASNNTILRAWGKSTLTFEGAVQTPQGSSHSCVFRDGGTIVFSGDLSNYSGTLSTADANPSVILLSPVEIGENVTINTASNSKNIQIQPVTAAISFAGTFSGSKPLEQNTGTLAVDFSGTYASTAAYLLNTGSLNLTGTATGITVSNGAVLTGTGTAAAATLNNGSILRSTEGLTITALTLNNGAKIEIDPSWVPTKIESLSVVSAGIVSVVFANPESMAEGMGIPLFNAPPPEEFALDLANFTLPAGYRIIAIPATDDRVIYTLVSSLSLTRSFTADSTWHDSGAAVWEDQNGNFMQWTDDSSATINPQLKTVTLTQDARVYGLVFNETKGNGSAQSKLVAENGAVLRLIKAKLDLGVDNTGNGNGSTRCIPLLSAAIDCTSESGVPQDLLLSGVGGNSGYNMTYFEPTAIAGVNSIRLSANAFALRSPAMDSAPLYLNGTTLAAVGSAFTSTTMNIATVGSSTIYLRGYGGNTMDIGGILRNETFSTRAVIDTIDAGSQTLRFDMTDFNGTIRQRLTGGDHYLTIHSDSILSATTTLDASNGANAKIILQADAPMNVPGALIGGGKFFKRGDATLTFSGTSTATGAFDVEAGELLLTGSITKGTLTAKSGTTLTVDATGTLSTTATLESGATFGGLGTVTVAPTVQAGATLIPGARITELALPGGAILKLAPDGEPFTLDALTLTATAEDPVLFDLEAGQSSVAKFPLFILPEEASFDPECFKVPAYARFTSAPVEGEEGLVLWSLSKSAGIYISIY